MTDKQLYRLCKKFGRRALEARRRFAGLLPEVLRRRLYMKKGFTSIYEFAARLAGLSREHVDTVLRLDLRFEGMPELHRALVEGRISPNQLVRVASVATTDNQKEMFEVARKLSRRALDVFVKDYRSEIGMKNSGGNLFGDDAKNAKPDGLLEPLSGANSLAGQTLEGQVGGASGQGDSVGQAGAHPDSGAYVGQNASAEPNHDFEIMAKLSPEVKKKIKEMMDRGLDINKELMEFFEARERKVEQEKADVAREIREEKTEAAHQNKAAGEKQVNQAADEKQESPTRYIPAKTKRILKKEYGVKCAKSGCKKKAKNIHHIQEFALTKDNSPQNLQPLCAGHHELEHMDAPYGKGP